MKRFTRLWLVAAIFLPLVGFVVIWAVLDNARGSNVAPREQTPLHTLTVDGEKVVVAGHPRFRHMDFDMPQGKMAFSQSRPVFSPRIVGVRFNYEDGYHHIEPSGQFVTLCAHRTPVYRQSLENRSDLYNSWWARYFDSDRIFVVKGALISCPKGLACSMSGRSGRYVFWTSLLNEDICNYPNVIVRINKTILAWDTYLNAQERSHD